jgi:hypothetical protein
MALARGVLPTYVTERAVILCKVAPIVRDTYEVRLCLFMAIEQGLPFVLSVRHGAKVDAGLEEVLRQHGGLVVPNAGKDFTVSTGVATSDGKARTCWVLGHDDALRSLHGLVKSPWFTKAFTPGATFAGDDLNRLQMTLRGCDFQMKNVDEEDVRRALLELAVSASRCGGVLFVQ